MSKGDIKAFTIMEILVVLILSGILMAVVGGIFYNLQLYKDTLEQKAIPVNNQQKIEYLVASDIEFSQSISMENNELICIRERDTITYQFGDTFFERVQSTIRDTINVNCEVTKIVETEGLLSSFELIVTDEFNGSNSFFFSKTYDVAQYFNLEK